MNHQICIHTDDKQYNLHSVERTKLARLDLKVINENTKPNPNALGGRIWADTELYWKRETSYRWIDDATMDKMITAALLEASIRTPLKIRKKNRKMSDTQLVINWLGKKDDSYLTSPSILGYTWGPGAGLGGNCVMNSDALWLLRTTPLTAKEAKELGYIENYANPTNTIKYFDPLHTLKHEMGHGLGMKHLTEQKYATSEIMYPFYNGLRKFGTADINYLISLYGKASVNKMILDTITSKIANFGK